MLISILSDGSFDSDRLIDHRIEGPNDQPITS
jgi:hypothetical protein